MNQRSMTDVISLDWDCKKREFNRRMKRLLFFHKKNIIYLMWRISPTKKGFHVKFTTKKKVNEFDTRFNLQDDPLRILLDLRRPDTISGILWDKKVITKHGKRKSYHAEKWNRII